VSGLKLAILSDIHSNLEALVAVIKDMKNQGVNSAYCLGDVIGYGPFPKTCLSIVRRICKIILKGNHEDCICDQTDLEEKLNDYALEGIRFSIRLLSKKEVNFIKTFSMTKVIKELDLSLSHGSFSDPEKWQYIETPEDAEAELKLIPTRLCMVGHTHIPYVFGNKKGLYDDLPDNLLLDKTEKFLINVGSVGQPRDEDCRASYGILEYKKGEVRFDLRRVAYEISKTARAMKKSGLPKCLYQRLFVGR